MTQALEGLLEELRALKEEAHHGILKVLYVPIEKDKLEALTDISTKQNDLSGLYCDVVSDLVERNLMDERTSRRLNTAMFNLSRSAVEFEYLLVKYEMAQEKHDELNQVFEKLRSQKEAVEKKKREEEWMRERERKRKEREDRERREAQKRDEMMALEVARAKKDHEAMVRRWRAQDAFESVAIDDDGEDVTVLEVSSADSTVGCVLTEDTSKGRKLKRRSRSLCKVVKSIARAARRSFSRSRNNN